MSEWYTKTTFGALVDDMATRFGTREALVFGDERYTFAEVRERVDEVARGLIGLGVKPGDHVALWLMNRPEWIFTMFALARIGAVQVPVNTRFRTTISPTCSSNPMPATSSPTTSPGPSTTSPWCAKSSACPHRAWPCATPGFRNSRASSFSARAVTQAASISSRCSTQRAKSSPKVLAARVAAVDPDHPVFIMYTSGTTGFPQGRGPQPPHAAP